jgi:hypothetical protein
MVVLFYFFYASIFYYFALQIIYLCGADIISNLEKTRFICKHFIFSGFSGSNDSSENGFQYTFSEVS